MRTNRLEIKQILVASLFAAACGTSFEKSSEPIDLRVLAIKSEPPEIIAGGTVPATVKLTALVVDPRDPSKTIAHEWRTCVPGLSSGSGGGGGGPPAAISGGADAVDVTPDGRCSIVGEEGVVEKGTAKLDAMSVNVPVPAATLQQVEGLASAGTALSAYLTTQLRLGPGAEEVYSVKRTVVAPALPAGRVPNRNPRITGVLFDGEPWEATKTLKIKADSCADDKRQTVVDRTTPGIEKSLCGHDLTPVFDTTDREKYSVQTFGGVKQDYVERMRFRWFVEHGSVTSEATGDPAVISVARSDPLSTKWVEPPAVPASKKARVWVVMRDGRGGTDWIVRDVEFE